jgi:hypothetical protein
MNGIPKGLCSFGGVQRRRLWSLFTVLKNSEIIRRRSARVNSENNPMNCFRKRDALQERASFNGRILSAPTNINFDLIHNIVNYTIL